VTRTEPVGWTRTTTRELRRSAQKKQRDCTTVGVCAKEIKKELNTLDEADFVRDVANRDYHYLSQSEIRGGKRNSLISIWIGIILVTLLSVVSDCPTNRPLIVLGPALVANSLFPQQEKHTMHRPDV